MFCPKVHSVLTATRLLTKNTNQVATPKLSTGVLTVLVLVRANVAMVGSIVQMAQMKCLANTVSCMLPFFLISCSFHFCSSYQFLFSALKIFPLFCYTLLFFGSGPNTKACNPYKNWTCGNGACIEKHNFCDGKFDCPDRSDEISCQAGNFSKIFC